METLIALAQTCVQSGRPRYKIRPKVHILHCQILLRLEAGSRFNPRYGSCFIEEDLVGQVVRLVKQSVHSNTVSRRTLQRWCLQYNSWLATLGEKTMGFAIKFGDPTGFPYDRDGASRPGGRIAFLGIRLSIEAAQDSHVDKAHVYILYIYI